MVKNVLSEIGGVGLYGIVSICLFFLVFTGALLWTLLQRQTLMNTMGELPLADGEVDQPVPGDSRHE